MAQAVIVSTSHATPGQVLREAVALVLDHGLEMQAPGHGNGEAEPRFPSRDGGPRPHAIPQRVGLGCTGAMTSAPFPATPSWPMWPRRLRHALGGRDRARGKTSASGG